MKNFFLKKMAKQLFGTKTLFVVFALIFGFAGATHAATAPTTLGVATGYSVFGAAGVTNNSAVGTTHLW